jgi:uncharacterized membrane protein
MDRLRIRENLGGVLIVLGIILMVAANASAVGGPPRLAVVDNAVAVLYLFSDWYANRFMNVPLHQLA